MISKNFSSHGESNIHRQYRTGHETTVRLNDSCQILVKSSDTLRLQDRLERYTTSELPELPKMHSPATDEKPSTLFYSREINTGLPIVIIKYVTKIRCRQTTSRHL